MAEATALLEIHENDDQKSFQEAQGLLQSYPQLKVIVAPTTAGAALSSGQITGKEGEKFKAGKLGDYTIGANGAIALRPPLEFTPANIDQYHF